LLIKYRNYSTKKTAWSRDAAIVNQMLIPYIKNMKTKSRARMVRRVFRTSAITIAVLFLLVLVVDHVIMPAYVQQGKVTQVPNVVGVPLEDAKVLIIQAGLQPKEAEFKADRQYPEGTVIQQTPQAGAEVKFGRGIYLTISGGEVLVAVPNLRGKSIRDATFDLERFGLKLGDAQYAPSDEFFENTIVSQGLQAGAKVKAGTSIAVVVSLGKTGDRQPVPTVMLKTLTEAEKLLTTGGFSVGKVTYQISLDLLPNTVIEQYPRAGELARIGQPVDLIVAQKAEAKNTLEN